MASAGRDPLVLVVLAPITGWLLFRERIGRSALLAVLVAVVGVALLTLRGAGFGPGELITCGAAALWGLHVVLLSRWARPTIFRTSSTVTG